MCAIALERLTVVARRPPRRRCVDLEIARRRVAGADRAERRRQDDAAPGDRAPRRVLRARSRSTGAPTSELRRDRALAARRHRPAGSLDAAVDDGRRVRAPRADAASWHPRQGGARDREVAAACSRPARPARLSRPASRDALRRGAAARRRRARARAGGPHRAARRADSRARHRPPAAGARAARRPPRRVRAHARRRDARPDARRAVRRPDGAARRRSASSPTARRARS